MRYLVLLLSGWISFSSVLVVAESDFEQQQIENSVVERFRAQDHEKDKMYPESKNDKISLQKLKERYRVEIYEDYVVANNSASNTATTNRFQKATFYIRRAIHQAREIQNMPSVLEKERNYLENDIQKYQKMLDHYLEQQNKNPEAIKTLTKKERYFSDMGDICSVTMGNPMHQHGIAYLRIALENAHALEAMTDLTNEERRWLGDYNRLIPGLLEGFLKRQASEQQSSDRVQHVEEERKNKVSEARKGGDENNQDRKSLTEEEVKRFFNEIDTAYHDALTEPDVHRALHHLQEALNQGYNLGRMKELNDEQRQRLETRMGECRKLKEEKERELHSVDVSEKKKEQLDRAEEKINRFFNEIDTAYHDALTEPDVHRALHHLQEALNQGYNLGRMKELNDEQRQRLETRMGECRKLKEEKERELHSVDVSEKKKERKQSHK